MKTGLFLVTANAETAEKLTEAGLQLAAKNGSLFIFFDDPKIQFSFAEMGICRTSNLTF